MHSAGTANRDEVGPQRLRERCCRLLHRTAGGSSMLINAVEEMPPAVRDPLLDQLAGLECTRRPYAAVRLISSTTVSLLDRVAAGTFSEQLFYRVNVIHLMTCDLPLKGAAASHSAGAHLNDTSTPKAPR